MVADSYAVVKPMDETAAPSDSSEHPTTLSTLLLRGGGITMGVVALMVLLRLFAVAGWNWHRAAPIAETIDIGDVATIAVGTVFEQPILTGLVVMVAFPLMLDQLIWRTARDPDRRIVFSLLILGELVVAIALVGSMHQWWLPLGAVFITGALVVAELLGQHPLGRRLVHLTVRGLGVAAVASSLFLTATVSTPWTPRETITTNTGVIDGYVVETSPDFLKVIVRDRQEMIIVPSSDVVSREFFYH